MITEDYVSFETAKLLKEKGFDECTLLSYDKNGNNKDALRPFLESEGDVRKPTLQMAMKWLREKYCLEIYPYHTNLEKVPCWWFEIIRFPSSVDEYETAKEYNTYEEACEAAVKYCLENLI